MNIIDEIIDKEDIEKIAQIERLRDELKKSSKIITFRDYGAGSPNEKRSVCEMDKGVITTKKLSELSCIGLKDKWALLLYTYVKKYKPMKILELGTCLGFSALYMAMANSSSTVYTIEGSTEIAEIARQNFEKMNCTNIVLKVGKFKDVLKSTLKEMEEVNMAFIDGHHRKDATLQYFETIMEYAVNGTIFIFDDISWSDEMRECWDIIKENKFVKCFEDFEKVGIVYI